ETQQFWIHVRLAGLAPGPTSGASDYRPNNAAGGLIGMQSGTACTAAGTPTASCVATYLTPIKDASGNAIRGSYVICSTGILGKYVKQLDTQMDDGNTATGSMMAVPNGSAAATSATATTAIDDAAAYTVCYGV
ncbi:MAG: prepilin-type cleavage/methylation domain-containing protein, partial [Betaproteobacteria bacterium]|nr:prepilin-type cleavage/methylation domain-containing protein [Betaproteobacteria bacterium]